MKMLLSLFILMPFLATAQANKGLSDSTGGGIFFLHNVSWRDVIQKARDEHKYIFVDCYTTWCGPCKMMDREVYRKDSVGKFMNDQFVSIKLQMDSTAHDIEEIRNWYGIARDFERKYSVTSFPTFLFFDPHGIAVHKVIGAVNADKFIIIGQNALNPKKQYYTVVKNFEPGAIDTAELKGLA